MGLWRRFALLACARSRRRSRRAAQPRPPSNAPRRPRALYRSDLSRRGAWSIAGCSATPTLFG